MPWSPKWSFYAILISHACYMFPSHHPPWFDRNILWVYIFTAVCFYTNPGRNRTIGNLLQFAYHVSCRSKTKYAIITPLFANQLSTWLWHPFSFIKSTSCCDFGMLFSHCEYIIISNYFRFFSWKQNGRKLKINLSQSWLDVQKRIMYAAYPHFVTSLSPVSRNKTKMQIYEKLDFIIVTALEAQMPTKWKERNKRDVTTTAYVIINVWKGECHIHFPTTVKCTFFQCSVLTYSLENDHCPSGQHYPEAVVNTAMNFRVPWKLGDFLTSWVTKSF